MRSSLAVLALLSLSVAPLAARADVLNFTLTTTIDGALKPDAVNPAGPEIDFSNLALTISGSYDTAAVSGGDPSSVAVLLTYTIGNMGSFASATDIYGGVDFLSLSNSGKEVSVGSNALGTTVEAIDSTALAALDLTHPFSVTASTASGFNAVDIVHAPAGGLYDFFVTSNDGPVTFTLGNPAVTPPTSPSAVPEPSSLMLLSTGALGLLGAARRRFVRA